MDPDFPSPVLTGERILLFSLFLIREPFLLFKKQKERFFFFSVNSVILRVLSG